MSMKSGAMVIISDANTIEGKYVYLSFLKIISILRPLPIQTNALNRSDYHFHFTIVHLFPSYPLMNVPYLFSFSDKENTMKILLLGQPVQPHCS